ncbi:MAG: hypothetical protein ACQKBY_06270 [Verrucomicrobiales bacterium]
MAESGKQSFSIVSILAIVAAIASFNVGAMLGLLCALLAFLFGVWGMIVALSPQTRGGIVSFLAVGLSFIGVIAAIVKVIAWFF